MAKRIISKGHTVIATSRGDYSAVAKDLGASFYPDVDDFCEEHPDIVILSTSILSTEKVLREFPFQRLRRNTLFCDVLSVKQFPKQLFLKLLPKNFDILYYILDISYFLMYCIGVVGAIPPTAPPMSRPSASEPSQPIF